MLIRRYPSLPGWSSAFRDLDDMRRDMERMFESLSGFAGTRTAGVFPPINVYDTPDGVRTLSSRTKKSRSPVRTRSTPETWA